MIQVIVKVASRCNLNCSYCYVYNKGDTSWRGRPPRMSDEIFTAALDRAHEYAEAIGDRAVSLVFHGGEPTLIGPDRFHAWCVEAREHVSGLPHCTVRRTIRRAPTTAYGIGNGLPSSLNPTSLPFATTMRSP